MQAKKQNPNKKAHCVVPENIHTSPTEGIFSNTSPPFWKGQESFIHFFIFFDLPDSPIPREIPIPSVGGVWIFS